MGQQIVVLKIHIGYQKGQCENPHLDLVRYRYLFDFRITHHTTKGSTVALLTFIKELKS